MEKLGLHAGEKAQLFRRMVFNIVTRNQDDLLTAAKRFDVVSPEKNLAEQMKTHFRTFTPVHHRTI